LAGLNLSVQAGKLKTIDSCCLHPQLNDIQERKASLQLDELKLPIQAGKLKPLIAAACRLSTIIIKN
jgi:hypothetical protein